MKTIKTFNVNNNIISNYSVITYSSGIIHLQVNTVERWIAYSRSHNNRYIFETDIEEEFILEIPESDFKIDGKYVCTDNQEKDQIGFYYTPYSLLDIDTFMRMDSRTILPVENRNVLAFKTNKTTIENLFDIYSLALKALAVAEQEIIFLKNRLK